MPKYDIDAVGLECQAAYKVLTAAAKLSGNIDPQRQKQHDDKFTKAMMVPVKEVKEYYEDFAERVAIFKKESKGAMDRIERTLKSKGSKLEPVTGRCWSRTATR